MKSALLERNLKILGATPVLIDTRPSEEHKGHGSLPLIGATMKVILSHGGFKSVQVFIDDKEIKPSIFGTQILYLPAENEISDGEHTVKVVVASSMDLEPVKFEPWKLDEDKMPPTYKVTPDSGQ